MADISRGRFCASKLKCHDSN